MKNNQLVIIIFAFIIVSLIVITNTHHFERETTIQEENALPIANFIYSPRNIMSRDETVYFMDNSSDNDGEIVEWHWDFDDDGIVDSTAQNPNHRYVSSGTYTTNLTIVDNEGAKKYFKEKIEVYNLGVLVVAHGFPGRWSQSIKDCVGKVSLPVPVELGFLEYVPSLKIEDAVEKLKDQEVDRIIAVPLFVCGNSTHTAEIYETLEELETDQQILCTTSLEDHPLLVDILIDHGKTLCKDDTSKLFDKKVDPKDATLIFFGHGDPGEYGENWISMAGSIKEKIEKKDIFKEVKYCFMHTGKGLRKTVKESTGHPLVVPLFVAHSSFSEIPTRKALMGYLITGRCEYDGCHLTDHSNIPRWIETQLYNYKSETVWANCYVPTEQVST